MLPRRFEEQVQEILAILREHAQILKEHAEILHQHAEQIAELVEAQKRTEQRLEELAEAQKRTEQRVEELAEAQKRTEQRLEELAEAQKRTEEQLQALIEAQKRTEQRLEELVEAQKRTEEQVALLFAAQRRIEEGLDRVLGWQRGEEGRRSGEQYERQVIRRAVMIFRGGDGGSPEDPFVRRRLQRWLAPIWRQEEELSPEQDPLLADLIWQKDDEVVVAEVSLKVDRYDVVRAAERAATLRKVGLLAIPVVIGSEWASPEAYSEALLRQVEWLVGKEMSDGFRRFQQKESQQPDFEESEPLK